MPLAQHEAEEVASGLITKPQAARAPPHQRPQHLTVTQGWGLAQSLDSGHCCHGRGKTGSGRGAGELGLTVPRKGVAAIRSYLGVQKTRHKGVKPLLLELAVQLMGGCQKSHSKDTDTQMK